MGFCKNATMNTPEHVSSLRNVHSARQSTRGVKKKEKEIHVAVDSKVTRLFFIFSFCTMATFRPATRPLNLSDCQLSRKLLRSVFSLLSLLQCIVGSAVLKRKKKKIYCQAKQFEAFSKTNQLLLYIVCVNARWEPSHAARRRKNLSHLYIVPNVCMYRLCVCVCMGWGVVCVYLIIFI